MGYRDKPQIISFNVGNRIVEIEATWLLPNEAAKMLKFNTKNRRIRRAAVAAIKTDISEKGWHFTGDTIKIACDEYGIEFVADGQHRLEAIANGDCAVPVIIVRNIDANATDLIDQARNRTVADILRMTHDRGAELENENAVAAIGRVLMAGEGLPTDDRKAVAHYVDTHFARISRWAGWAHGIGARTATKVEISHGRYGSPMPTASVGALALVMAERGGFEHCVKDFFQRLATGIVSEADQSNVIQLLRRRQANGMTLARSSGGRMTAGLFTEYAVYINAYNKWVRNEPVASIRGIKSQVSSFSQLPSVLRVQHGIEEDPA